MSLHIAWRALLSVSVVLPLLVSAQGATGRASRVATSRGDTVGTPARGAPLDDAVGEPRRATLRRADASRTSDDIVLDGRDGETTWREATVIDAFRMWMPTEDADPSFRTEARIAYDDKALYVFVRMYDPHPDSIVGLLSRRDTRTPSDWVTFHLDSYHDRRTAFAFSVNPLGVQRDHYIFNDGNEDNTWDAVWDARTAIDSLGWTAEFRIPLGQLRFPQAPEHTFGVLIDREVQRLGERASWPVFRRSRVGIVSQFGDVDGFTGLRSPSRLEVRPYLVERNVTTRSGSGNAQRAGREQQHAAGLDVKYGLGANLTLDATINPDFGQVEADPAVLNLSAFEQFFQERRPFFIEGGGLFRFDINCNDGECTGLFYPRRIGRSPQLAGRYGDASTPQFSTILGAAKITGRLPSGTSVALLEAVTRDEAGPLGRTVEPMTNYGVARVVQEFRGGNTTVGAMLTSVQRQEDEWTRDFLRRSALAAGIDARHRFAGNRYQLNGFIASSRVAGSAASIAATQRSNVHGFARPDGSLEYDSTRTSLTGNAMEIGIGKIGGGSTRFQVGYQRIGAGFEINDIGFLQRSDEQSQFTWFQWRALKPTRFYRNLTTNVNQWSGYTTAGMPRFAGGNVNLNLELPNFWRTFGGVGVENPIGALFDDRAARGGPAVRRNPGFFSWLGFELDPRRSIVPFMNFNGGRSDLGRSWNASVSPGVRFRSGGRLQGSIAMSMQRRAFDWQWVGNYFVGTDSAQYTFAHLDQVTRSVTARLDVTATPTLSLQLYAQPFVTVGDYRNWRTLVDGRAEDYDARFAPRAGDPGGFNFKQFRSNAVVRWEYRPGSTLFVVWQQGRTQDGVNPGVADFRRDVGDLFSVAPDNTFLVKMSYWFGR